MRWTHHVIVATTVALTGGLIGSGLSALLAAKLLVPAMDFGPPPTATYGEPPEADVLAGNLFRPDVSPSHDPRSAVPTHTRCEDGWTLVGVLCDPLHPERSIAAVHAPEGAAVLGVGGTHGTRTLVDITRTEAHLRTEDGGECSLAMFAETAQRTVSSPPARQTSPRAPSPVRRMGDDHYQVARSAIEATAAAPGVVVRPALSDGEMIGAGLYGIRRDGLLHDAGLRNGDVIRAIDGATVSGPAVALEAYGRLMRGEAVEITVDRGGERHAITYELPPREARP